MGGKRTRLLCPGEPLDGLLDDQVLDEMVRQGRAIRVAESEAA